MIAANIQFFNPPLACIARPRIGRYDPIAVLAVVSPLNKRIEKPPLPTIGDGVAALAILNIVIRLA